MCKLRNIPTLQAAEQFVDLYFPQCDGTMLAGSVSQERATVTSDLDSVIFDQLQPVSYRESQ